MAACCTRVRRSVRSTNGHSRGTQRSCTALALAHPDGLAVSSVTMVWRSRLSPAAFTLVTMLMNSDAVGWSVATSMIQRAADETFTCPGRWSTSS